MLKFSQAALLWLVSEACHQTSMSTWVTFKWLHITLTSRQPAVIYHMTGCIMSMAMDLAALRDMWM